ncbi:MAG: DUF1295 domain-containing protein [Chitinophagales bacterium]
MIPNHLGWFWMELPALLVFPLMVIFGPNAKNSIIWILVGLWTLHYVNRAIIFPFRLHTKNKKMPLSIAFMAVVFNVINGFFNGYYLGFITTPAHSIFTWNVSTGILLFLTGMFINLKADNTLIHLRSNGDGYVIPQGWLFRYISCPNHFGEIMEWTGFAMIAWNFPALSFAIWTFTNLMPRAINHHIWYKQTFPHYPTQRKAVIPYII